MEKLRVISRGGLENQYAKKIEAVVMAENLFKANDVVIKKYGPEYVAIPADSENCN